MRNIIMGGIGVLWGGGILIYGLFFQQKGGGAYGTGQTAGMVFGGLLLVVGLYYLVDGLRNLGDGSSDDEADSKPRKPKKPKRRADDDD